MIMFNLASGPLYTKRYLQIHQIMCLSVGVQIMIILPVSKWDMAIQWFPMISVYPNPNDKSEIQSCFLAFANT